MAESIVPLRKKIKDSLTRHVRHKHCTSWEGIVITMIPGHCFNLQVTTTTAITIVECGHKDCSLPVQIML